MAPTKPFIVGIYSTINDRYRRQVLAVDKAQLKANLCDEAIKIGGEPDGDWFAFNNDEGVNALIQRTKEMGGLIYDLPFH